MALLVLFEGSRHGQVFEGGFRTVMSLLVLFKRTKDGLVFFLCDGTWSVLQSFQLNV